MSLFGMDWAAGTEVGEILKREQEQRRVERRREHGGQGFYVPADLSDLQPGGFGVKPGKAN